MSQSARIYERFAARLWSRRTAAIVYLLSALVYLGWRATIINEHALFLSGMYYLSDLIAVLLGAVTIFVSWNYWHRRSPPAAENLSVDVFVPTYQEPVEMVRRTLAAARAIRYPHETWLLDDGNRPEMRALAEELECRYLARTDNAGAKAGNLNHGLAASSGEFVAVFDADHIPLSRALDATLGFFADPMVGMVQAPQDYYNTDALQYMNPRRGGGLWHDQSFFYNLSQPGRDHWNAASCAGTSVVYRRSAIQAIGGIPAETVTEDVHTSLKLQKAGFAAPYLNEPIAYGIAAADLSDYYRTRLRYGHGNIHALRTERILFCKGLSLQQRLSYLFLGLIYLEGWQQLMVFLVPSLALILGWAPFDITIFNVLVVLVFPLWSYLLMQEIGCGFSRYWTAELYSMMRFPVHILASLALFQNRMAWRVSRKNVKGRFSLLLLAPQIFVLVLSLTALGIGIYRLDGHYKPGPLVAVVVDRLPARETIDAQIAVVTDRVGALSELVVAALTPEKPATPVLAEKSPPGESVHGDRPTAAEGLGGPAAEATKEIPVSAPAKPVVRKAPPPIDWFEPFTKGYTIDLVLIAGFWAFFNALRVLFVIVKVARNARRTRADYLFHTLTPIRFDTPAGPLYAVAERLSSMLAIIASKALRNQDFSSGVEAIAYLPSGAARLVLRRDDSGRRRGKHSRFTIEFPSNSNREIFEAGLYATSWHRECHHNDAEFATPLGALARLLGFAPRDRSPWQAALLFGEEHADPEIALLKRTGELLLLAEKEPANAALRVIVIDHKGFETRRLLLRELIASAPLYMAVSDARRRLHYRTQDLAAPADVALLQSRLRRGRAKERVTIAAEEAAERVKVV